MIPTDQLPATKVSPQVIAQVNDRSITLVNDLLPWGGANTPPIMQPSRPAAAPTPAPTPAPAAPAPAATPLSTYLILGGIISALGYFAWRQHKASLYGMPEGGDGGGPVKGLDDLVSVQTYALPISDTKYAVVEEISRTKTKTKVRFPYSDAQIWVAPEDLVSEAEAKKQGLEEHT
jgi:hypothetical protein